MNTGKKRFWLHVTLILGGTLTGVILVSLIWQDLFEIYQLQRDLVVGTFFSLTTFFFQRAVMQTEDEKIEARTIEKIKSIENLPKERSDIKKSEVGDEFLEALYAKIENYKRDSGLLEEIREIENRTEQAYNRISDFYDEVAASDFFHENRYFINGIVEEIDKIASNTGNLKEIMHPSRGSDFQQEMEDVARLLNEDAAGNSHLETEDISVVIGIINRHIKEALNRRNQAYQELNKQADFKQSSMFTNNFDIITTDLTKAQKTLLLLRSEGRANDAIEFTSLINQAYEYLMATQNRLREFSELATEKLDLPPVFNVFEKDIENAIESLRKDFSPILRNDVYEKAKTEIKNESENEDDK